jgi:caffeoyl-CoA O-methyltransferase
MRLLRLALVAALSGCAGGAESAVGAAGAAGAAGAQGAAATASAPVDQVLAAIRKADKGQLAVSEEDGKFLSVLVASTGAKRVLEIGAASGYSAIWMGLGARQTGGTVTTIEYDAVRAHEATENIRRAGLQDIVQVIAGDAFKEVPKVPGTFDLVFLDAWKPDYKKFFDLVFPRVAPGGVFLAHNVINKRQEMPDFLAVIQTHPQAVTTIVSPGSEGISITYKKRR